MFFSTIEDEATRSGLRITNIFSSTLKNIVAIFQQKQGIKFDSVFSESLQNDRTALLNYRSAINSGLSDTEAFKMTMTNASKEAQTFVQTLAQSGQSVNIKAISDFTKQQKMANVTLQAQDTSLGNVRAMLNEYNSGMQSAGNVCANTGLTQAQFTASVNQSNSSLGQYLIGLEGGKASMAGYTAQLVGAKLAAIGLRIATTALNAVIGMGIGLIVSLVASGVMQLIEYAKENMKPLAEQLDDVNSRLKETQTAIKDISSTYKELKENSDEVIPRFVELAKGVNSFGKNVTLTDEEYAEFLELNNKIAEMFPELNMGMDDSGNAMLNLSYSADTLTASLQALVEAQRQQANQELAEKLPDLVSDIKSKNELLKQEIDSYEKQIQNYQDLLNGTYKVTSFGGDIQSDSFKAKGINTNAAITDSGTGYMNYKWEEYTYSVSDDASKRVINDYIAGLNRKIENVKSQIENSWQSASSSLQAWLQTNSTFESFGTSLQNVANMMLQNTDWSKLGLETDEEITGYIETHILEPLSQADMKTQAAFDDLVAIEPSQFDSASAYMDAIKNKITEIANMSDIDGLDYESIFSGLGYDEIFKKYNDAIDGIKGLLPEVSDEMIKALAPDEVIEAFDYIKTNGIQSWDDLQTFIGAKRFSDAFNIEDIEELKDELNNLKDAYDDITDIIDDYNDNGYYTLENLESLLELEPEYINALVDENGQINLNSQAYKDYVSAKAKVLVVDQIKSLYETVLAMSTEEAQAYANAEAYNTEAESLGDLISATTSYYLVLARAKDSENNTTAYTDSLKQSFKTVANYAAIYDSWLNSLSGSNNEFSTAADEATSALEAQKSALESEKSALEDYKDSLEDAKDALEDYKDSLSDAKDNLQNLIDLTTDYIKQLKEDEKSALEEQKDNFDDIIAKKKEALELAKEEREEADKLADKQKSVAKDRLALAIAQLDDSSAGKKAQKQTADSFASSQKDLSDYLYEKEYNARIAALEAEQEAFDNSIDEQIKKIDEYLDNARQLYEDACSMIDNDTGDLYGKLWGYTYKYTTQTRAEFDYLWSNAQAAIQRYKGDNDTLISTMEFLQGKIYDTDRQINDLNTQIDNCETQIGYLDDAISSTSDAISATSDSIDSVSGSLDGLSASIASYIEQLNNLANTDVGNNSGANKTKFWVTHNGKTYSTDYKYNGDTTNNRLLAAAELTKMIAKDVSGFDQYGLGIVQGYLGVGNGNAKQWYYDFQGKRYTAVSAKKENAISQIIRQIESDYGTYPASAATIYGQIKHYSGGTRNSDSLAITQESGFEAIFGKLSKGQYTMMPQGSQVFNADMTDNLWKFSSDPQKFISDVIGKMSSFLSSSYGNFADSARGVTNKVTKYGGDVTLSSAPVYHIYGNVDKNTLSTMDKQERQRYELFKKQFMLEMLREKNNL